MPGGQTLGPMQAPSCEPSPAIPVGQPLVSIVYVTYNQERFAREAIRSVLSQTYAPLEFIIMDDASTDETGTIILTELATHRAGARVLYLRNPHNLGAFRNTEQGLFLVKGEFIVYFNGDDVMLPEMTAEMV